MFKVDDKVLMESLNMIKSMENKVYDYYKNGNLDLERYKSYKNNINILFLYYNKIMSVNSFPFAKVFLKLKKSKVKDLKKVNRDFFVEVMNMLQALMDKDFVLLDSMFDNISDKEIEVKCFVCNKREIYKGQGYVINKQEEFETRISIVGEWVCSQECFNEL